MAEPEASLRIVAEAALDHAAVELLGRVARPEPEGALREAQRLTAVAGPRERPSQDVVTVDRGPVAAREPGESKRVREANAVVDVEERGLEIRSDAVRGEQAPDHADELVLAAREPLVPRHVLEVTERRHELR